MQSLKSTSTGETGQIPPPPFVADRAAEPAQESYFLDVRLGDHTSPIDKCVPHFRSFLLLPQ